jgi:chaperone BCS1
MPPTHMQLGVGVAGLGMGVALMRKSALSGLMLAERYLTVTMEVPSKDRSYHWVCDGRVVEWCN